MLRSQTPEFQLSCCVRVEAGILPGVLNGERTVGITHAIGHARTRRDFFWNEII